MVGTGVELLAAYKMTRIFFSFFIALLSTTAAGVCSERPVSLCEMVQKSDWVIRGKVETTQLVKDADDPEGVAGWLYHLNVHTTYLGSIKPHLIVRSENTTSRVVLEQGGDYFVFISRMPEEILETFNRCDKYSEAKYDKTLEDKIRLCVSQLKESAMDNKR